MTTAHALPINDLSLKSTVPAPRKISRLKAVGTTSQTEFTFQPEPAKLPSKWRASLSEPLGLVLLAIAVHGAIIWSALNRVDTPRIAQIPQEIELLRPPPEVKPEPPKPQEPKRQPPPKLVETPKQPPPLAQRTAPAEAQDPNTLSIAENLQAQHTTGPVVSAPPAPPPAPKAVEPVTEPNGFAGYLNNPPPVYPRAAQRLNQQGRVLLRVHVLANGQVGSAEIKQSSGTPLLDEAALNAVKAWTFAPAKRGSTPVDGWATVPIDFKLAT
jgi:protein TonB